MSQLQIGDKTFVIFDNIPAEYIALVDAISAFYYACESKTLCGACFQGKLDRPLEYKGCCGSCPNLSSTGCVQKPVGCARYSCFKLDMLVPEAFKSDFYKLISYNTGLFNNTGAYDHPGNGCYPDTVKRVSEYNYPPDVLARLAAAAKEVEALTERLKLSGYKPDWLMLETKLKAESGSLTAHPVLNHEERRQP